MGSGWESYYPILLSAGVAVSAVFLISLLSRALRPPITQSPKPALESSSRRELRFPHLLLAANIFVAMALILIPCVAVFKESLQEETRLTGRALVALISLGGFLLLGIMYATRKRVLSWTGETQPTESSE